MRHRKSGRKFDRPGDARRSLLKGLVGDLLRHERLQTTEAKAKEIRPIAERMITLGKAGTVPARRQAMHEHLVAARHVSPLFDSLRFARDIEALYERMMLRHVQGHAPAALPA